MAQRLPHEDDIGTTRCLSEADMLALMGGFSEESKVPGKTHGPQSLRGAIALPCLLLPVGDLQ